MQKEITTEELDNILQSSWQAFQEYKELSLRKRADFMYEIAAQLSLIENELIDTAAEETNLPKGRLKNELQRTRFQLTSYADFCASGEWLDARIDTADSSGNQNLVDIRKTMTALGPVVIFGAANFPFAYSTAGGDTACAFAAGCPVIVKAHNAHLKTSILAAEAISRAVANSFLPTAVFTHIIGEGNEIGERLIKHPLTKAVGFTGSYKGGKQLFDWGNQRAIPIPVFAEMSSINPVFLLPNKLQSASEQLAIELAASITLNAGQFCTNPGIIVAIDNDYLTNFQKVLSEKIEALTPEQMLNAGIYKNYVEKRAAALSQPTVETISVAEKEASFNEASPTIASVIAADFINNPQLKEEVFGPYSIIVKCKDMNEMEAVATSLNGQLTCTLMATEEDIAQQKKLIELVKNICGRLNLNAVPTGVRVCLSMQHGGPFPATTDSRFSAVGGDGIKKFARPIAYQNWPNHLLPDELKDENPWKIPRTMNNKFKVEIESRNNTYSYL